MGGGREVKEGGKGVKDIFWREMVRSLFIDKRERRHRLGKWERERGGRGSNAGREVEGGACICMGTCRSVRRCWGAHMHVGERESKRKEESIIMSHCIPFHFICRW